ncbi:MAG: four helix bundle protein [Anaerolineae bacterium SM23_ 63]|nr:MAG: four helix bundle protein [Anaerolineae bacterium SM23_ 63]
MRDFRSLKVWERSHHLAISIYGLPASFPKDERYGLSGQLRRSGVSIPANIAEGCGRSGEKELARFLNISLGSASELEYLLLLARDINLLDHSEFEHVSTDVIEIKKMLTSFIQKLKADS